MRYNFLLVVFVVVFFSGIVSSLGCCVDSDKISCSMNSEKEMCEDAGGTYYANDARCDSVDICSSGCCVLGVNSERLTKGKCIERTQLLGFSQLSFFKVDSDCSVYISSQDLGACTSLDNFGKLTCKFISRAQCGGSFFVNKICSEIQDSSCIKTENTICSGNNVYKVDSCGNRDSLVESCDYVSGSVCKEEYVGGKKTASCSKTKCIDDFYYTKFMLSGLYSSPSSYSPKTRNNGDVWCVTNGMVPFSQSELDRDFNKFGIPITSVSGLQFFSRSCINGEIVTELCEGGKGGYCSGESSWGDDGVSSGTGGRCVNNEWRNCINAESEEDCDPKNCFWFAPEKLVKSTSVKMIKDLDIGKCLPKIPGGQIDSASTSSVCSLADYETTFGFVSKMKQLSKSPKTTYGNAGLLLGTESDWILKDSSTLKAGDDNLYLGKGMAKLVSKGKAPFIVLNPEAVALLEYRCSMLYDCTGKINWNNDAGRNSSGGIMFLSADEIRKEFEERDISFPKYIENKLNEYLSSTKLNKNDFTSYPADKFPVLFGSKSKKTMDMRFEYSCVPRRAQVNGDCSKCSEDGAICSRYSCESLGANCEFLSIGINEGICQSGGDITAPQLDISCPSSSSIEINKPIEISVSTSEVAQCRFNLESQSVSYEGMSYAIGNKWGTTHNFSLISPGSSPSQSDVNTRYPLITKSGEYEIYVRCVDPKGNGATDIAKECKFTVPPLPDKNPPQIFKMYPLNNSPIRFNATSQEVSILINEPAECRWETKDMEFDNMNNEFFCDTNLKMYSDSSGYECVGNIDKVTNIPGASSTFYIRCRDQPDLEDDFDARNTNEKSFVYSLVSSAELKISEIAPSDIIVLGPQFNEWNLTVKTIGGGYDGVSDCKWRFGLVDEQSSYSSFASEQSTSKVQIMKVNISGKYNLSVVCTDNSNNIARYDAPFEIRYDSSPPSIIRIYNDKGYFKFITNEKAYCKLVSKLVPNVVSGCSFSVADPNITLISTSDYIEHSFDLIQGTNYFIKCYDFFYNENPNCAIISKMV